MSLAEACAWSLVRGVTLALLATPLCFLWCRLISSLSRDFRRIAWTALLAPFVCPNLLVGYVYANYSLSLVHHPFWNELLYDFLIMLKLVPVGTSVAYFAPQPPISPQAMHARLLALGKSQWTPGAVLASLGFWLRGPLVTALPVAAVVFLLTFQEFQMVSLMGITAEGFHTPPSWTVWLFDAHVQGLMLRQSLQFAAAPALCEIVVIFVVLWGVLAQRDLAAAGRVSTRPVPRATAAALAAYAAIALVFVCGVPLWILAAEAVSGFTLLWENAALFREIGVGMLYAATAGLGAYGLAIVLLGRRLNLIRLGVVLAACLPGLCGALAISLACSAMFQFGPLKSLYDTAIPLLAALVLWLLPRAIVIQLLLGTSGYSAAFHSVRLLAAAGSKRGEDFRELLWRLKLRGHFWALTLVCFWGYLNMTAPSVLRPSGVAPAPLRLYDFMHYGRTSGLSAMVVATLALPLLLTGAGLLGRRLLLRLFVR